MRTLFLFIFAFALSLSTLSGQKLSPFWDELTASDFTLAVQQSGGVCIIPIGVIEKHGQQLPLGTDVYIAREISRRAAEKEYCIIFPYYYMGQIFEAKQQPGTIAYSSDLILKMLEETCQEISRNGIKKIIIVNGHGGNTAFLQYFAQIQLASPRDYAVFVITPAVSNEVQRRITELRKSTTGGHADEVETSSVMAIRPDLVKLDRATSESGNNLNRLSHISRGFTGIGWYAQYPNHYAGDAKDANAQLGDIALEGRSEMLVELVRAVKADQATIRLQNEFFRESQSPNETRAK
jgi:creatinine amidohydrolase